jgi:hypothetical protein
MARKTNSDPFASDADPFRVTVCVVLSDNDVAGLVDERELGRIWDASWRPPPSREGHRGGLQETLPGRCGPLAIFLEVTNPCKHNELRQNPTLVIGFSIKVFCPAGY